MVVAYRGYSVILFAPIAAMVPVLLTAPELVPPMFTGLYMEKLVGFLKLYLPVFILGAVLGKVIELSGFSRSIAAAVISIVGSQRTILSIVAVCALLTYGGVSLFVVVFAVYPFAADLFRQADIPKRLIPGTIALGAFTFTMDCLPGSPQIQNIIPIAFFKTNIYAAPWLGLLGAVFILTLGLIYLDWRRRQAMAAGEGYGSNHSNEPESGIEDPRVHPAIAFVPLLLVGITNKAFAVAIPQIYGETSSFSPAVMGNAPNVVQDVSKIGAIWAVEGALLVGILSVLVLAWRTVRPRFIDGAKSAVSGALLAAANTASEYGFGAVIASLTGFRIIADTLQEIPNPLVNEAVSVTVLAGVTGSASGGMSIALAALSETFISNAQAANIPMAVLHRVAAMASGGMDTLPHNGAVITLLMVTGLTHRQSYQDIFAVTIIKTVAVFVVIAAYSLTGLV
ncbi:GntP family permease [Planctomicrobium piriforme]